MKRIFYQILLLLVSLASINAQADDLYNPLPIGFKDLVTEPAPAPGTFNRHIDCPVSYATGSYTLSVPLFSWDECGFPFSLSLDYTPGVKVEDKAGMFGLGWSLGGITGTVTRQIIGRPDEKESFYILDSDISNYLSTASVSDLRNLASGRKDAYMDKFYYSVNGYAGCFVINNRRVIQLSDNDVTITAGKWENEIPKTITITTPECWKYELEAIGTSSKETSVRAVSEQYFNSDYVGYTLWALKRLTLPDKASVISFTPSVDSHSKKVESKLYSTQFSNRSNQGGSTKLPLPENTITTTQCSFYGFLKIAGKKASITFNSEGKTLIGTIRNSSGDEVRRVEMELEGTIGGRERLASIAIYSGDELLDCRSFTYHDDSYSRTRPEACTDFFGYSNRKVPTYTPDDLQLIPEGSGGGNGFQTELGDYYDDHQGGYPYPEIVIESILTTRGELNPHRQYKFEHACSASLKEMTDANGLVTTITYEPNIAILHGTRNYTAEVNIGIRVRKIETVDQITGNTRTRDFVYFDPVFSNPIGNLYKHHFISHAGIKGLDSDAYQTTTFTSTCRVPGLSAEGTQILYGAVEETVTGTEISRPVKTRYEFDNSRSVNETFSVDISNEDGNRRQGEVLKYLGYGMLTYGNDFIVAGNNDITSGFCELFGQKSPMTRKIVYEYGESGGFAVKEETVNHYTHIDARSDKIGIYCETLCRLSKTKNPNHLSNTEDDIKDFATGIVTTKAVRTYLDSTVVIRYYPDGSTRRVSTGYLYSDRDSGRLFSVFGDEDNLRQGKLHRPWGSVVECAGTKIEKYDILGEHLPNSPYLRDNAGIYAPALPVISRVKVDGRVFTTRNYYKNFDHNLLPSRMITVGDDGSTVVDSMAVTGYNTCRRPLRILRHGRPAMVYTYQADSMDLKSSGIEGTGLVNSYTSIPLVGYTSVTTPSGNKTQYRYTGSRLTSVLDSDGKLVKGYEYHLFDPTEYIHGHIRERIYLNAAGTASVTTTSLFDSYGEQYATVAADASAPGVDIISLSALDALGRQRRQYLPFTAQAGLSYLELALFGDSIAQASTQDAVPYSEAVFKAGSASATPVITIDAGSDHREWKTRLDEKCNSATVPRLRCRRLSMTDDVTLRVQGNWPAGALDVTEVTDADGAVSLEFTDFRGRKLLSRRLLADGTQLDTYFVYDPWGNLVLVLPPMATPVSGNVTTSSSMKDYAYHYVYDKANRMVSKKLPGAEKITYGYDADGLPAFTQDGNMRRDGKAMFTLYDAAGRVAVTGLCSSSAMDACATLRMRATFSPSALGVDSTHYVTSASLPGAEMLTATYYDAVPAFLGVQYTATGVLAKPMGLVTAQVDRVLGTAGRTRVQTVNFYDSHERLIYTSSTTADGSTIKTDTEYDFAGNPVKIRRTTVAVGQTMTDTYAYGYDRLNRPTTVTLSHNGGDALTLVSNTYDALGRLRSNGAPGKAKTYYDYDLRGALNKLTSNHFTQSLYRGTGKYSSRSGRITRNDLNVTGRRLISDYLYDHAGRLTRAEAKLENTGVDYTQEMEYDLNANVTAMRRYGAINAREGALLDDLTIEYQGNRMEFVTDDAEAYPYEASLDFRARAPIASTPGASVAAPFSLLGPESIDGLTPNPAEPYNPLIPYNYTADFAYDANGNMTQDRHSAITSISYNVLNLPAEVLYEGLLENRPVSQMVYDAAGRKHIVRNGVKKLGAFTGDVTRYVGDYIIVNDTVDRLQTPYGYLRDGEFHSYVFDYQGNVMVVVSGDKVDQTNLYYADGLPMNVSTDATANRFKYSAKELSLFRGLPVYDYTARHTLPQLSNTFRTMDPCAESFYSISPYSYCGGDPINFIDPTGMEIRADLDGITYTLQDMGDGNYDFVNADGNVYQGNNELASQTGSTLLNLSSNSPTGIQLLNNMINSAKVCTISVGPESLTKDLGNGNSEINWNYNSCGNDPSINAEGTACYYSDPDTSFVHELQHALDIANDNFDQKVWYEDSNGNKVIEAEKSACKTENTVRKELNLPIRTHYGSSIIFYGNDSKLTPNPKSKLDYEEFLPKKNNKK